MKILLDTHLLLWWMSDDRSLTKIARSLISDPSNTVLVSAVSSWEIWLKKSLGKLEVPDNFDEVLAEQEFEALPLTADHTKAIASLPWFHRDPFDRMLISQATTAGLTLLTSDARLTAYGSFVKRV